MAESSNMSASSFCMELGIATTETHEMLLEAFGELSLSLSAVSERHSCFKACPVSVEDDKRSCDQTPAERQKFQNSSKMTITKLFMSS
jgi:hypothetical protein